MTAWSFDCEGLQEGELGLIYISKFVRKSEYRYIVDFDSEGRYRLGVLDRYDTVIGYDGEEEEILAGEFLEIPEGFRFPRWVEDEIRKKAKGYEWKVPNSLAGEKDVIDPIELKKLSRKRKKPAKEVEKPFTLD